MFACAQANEAIRLIRYIVVSVCVHVPRLIRLIIRYIVVCVCMHMPRLMRQIKILPSWSVRAEQAEQCIRQGVIRVNSVPDCEHNSDSSYMQHFHINTFLCRLGTTAF